MPLGKEVEIKLQQVTSIPRPVGDACARPTARTGLNFAPEGVHQSFIGQRNHRNALKGLAARDPE